MTIEKAMEILVDLQRHSSTAFSLAELDAINLGFEALKRLIDYRAREVVYKGNRLPGETET